MINLVKKTWAFILVIGTIGVTASIVFSEYVTFVTKQPIGNTGMYWYLFDLRNYLQNLQTALNIDFMSMIPVPPSLPNLDWTDAVVGIIGIAKILFLIVNWIIMILGYIVLLPIKLLAYIVIVITSILGIKTSDLYNVMQNVYNFNIPYLDYSWIGG